MRKLLFYAENLSQRELRYSLFFICQPVCKIGIYSDKIHFLFYKSEYIPIIKKLGIYLFREMVYGNVIRIKNPLLMKKSWRRIYPTREKEKHQLPDQSLLMLNRYHSVVYIVSHRRFGVNPSDNRFIFFFP